VAYEHLANSERPKRCGEGERMGEAHLSNSNAIQSVDVEKLQADIMHLNFSKIYLTVSLWWWWLLGV
jgi:hypothetical protein